jgi:hypothetical protein
MRLSLGPDPSLRHRVTPIFAIGFLMILLGGCADPVGPGGIEPEPPSETQAEDAPPKALAGVQLLVEEQCFNVDHCTLAPNMPNAECMCELAGVDTGGAPPPWLPPPIWPTIPDAPGWPGPGDGGTPPGGTEPCDIYGYEPGCWEASLTCTTGVTRGQTASCTASANPMGALEHVYTWYFEGEQLDVEQSAGGQVTWSGPVVESGTVMADVRISGGSVRLLSRIEVLPREGSAWAWAVGSGLDFDWNLTFPYWSDGKGRVCRPEAGCPPPHSDNDSTYWVTQPSHPSHGNGFELSQVSGNGPNQGAWYVSSVSMDVRMSAALNPLWLNTAPDDLPASCVAGDTNRWAYNHIVGCGDGGPGWGGQFLDWAQGHEEAHFQSVVQHVGTQVGTQLRFNLPSYFENEVRMEFGELRDFLEEQGPFRAGCIQQVAATHVDFPGPPVDIWRWSKLGSEWHVLKAADGPWWDELRVDMECVS